MRAEKPLAMAPQVVRAILVRFAPDYGARDVWGKSEYRFFSVLLGLPAALVRDFVTKGIPNSIIGGVWAEFLAQLNAAFGVLMQAYGADGATEFLTSSNNDALLYRRPIDCLKDWRSVPDVERVINAAIEKKQRQPAAVNAR